MVELKRLRILKALVDKAHEATRAAMDHSLMDLPVGFSAEFDDLVDAVSALGEARNGLAIRVEEEEVKHLNNIQDGSDS